MKNVVKITGVKTPLTEGELYVVGKAPADRLIKRGFAKKWEEPKQKAKDKE